VTVTVEDRSTRVARRDPSVDLDRGQAGDFALAGDHPAGHRPAKAEGMTDHEHGRSHTWNVELQGERGPLDARAPCKEQGQVLAAIHDDDIALA
jgi:hypothetical protein